MEKIKALHGQTTPKKEGCTRDRQHVSNYARKLDNSWLEIFVLELDGLGTWMLPHNCF
jgi:hypothetical protein